MKGLSLLICVVLSAFVTVITSSTAWSQQSLSELGLFYRCYEQLTQTQPIPTDPLLNEVRTGAKTAVQACMEVLNRARFTANGGTQIANTNDASAKAVLRTFHELHRTFPREKGYKNSDNDDFWTGIGSQTWWDESPYGSYVTRALFSPTANVDSVTTGTLFLQPVRTTMTPPFPQLNVPSVDREFRLGAAHPVAPQGELLGIRTVSIAPNLYDTPARFGGLYELPDFGSLVTPPAATRAITQVAFTDITAVRGPIPEVDHFGIQIQGQLRVLTAGSYTLFLDVDDGGAVYVDGARVVYRDFSGEGSGAISLSAGDHQLRIIFRQANGGARLRFLWQGPGISKQLVPAASLLGLNESFHTRSQSPAFNATGNAGGGFLGNHNYIMTTYIQGDNQYVPDGALRTNRTFMRAVMADLFGRTIPVVREVDAAPFVVSQSSTPFRRTAACTTCHATVDRGAGLLRGVMYAPVRSMQRDPEIDLVGIVGIGFKVPTLPEDPTWSDVGSSDYSQRTPYGHLYFRNYRGELINTVVRSLEELGAAARAQDDYYVNFARRYYEYFLGISVEIGDPGSPTYPQLNGPETYHRAQVIEMGLRLKSHKSLVQLIQEILSTPQYRLSDFGISYQG